MALGVEAEEPVRVGTHLEVVDALVLTQTCDLVQGKAAEVLLCGVVSWDVLVGAELARGNSMVAGSVFIEKLIEGAIPPLSLLVSISLRPSPVTSCESDYLMTQATSAPRAARSHARSPAGLAKPRTPRRKPRTPSERSP